MIEPSYLRPRDMPRERTLKPVALATMVCSKLIFEPSANEVTIAAFCPHRSAHPFWVVGLRYGSWSPFTLTTARGVSPSPWTQRTRFICSPGSSPSQAERMAPCFLAYTRRMGPMVASTSAFISTTGFR